MTTTPSSLKNKRALAKRYDLNQCALYRVGSKSRLALLLCTSLPRLRFLVNTDKNYRTFLLPEKVCPFTGKVTKERWVQEPKPELRRIHERLQKLLQQVTPPSYAHAAVKGRSYRSNALAHVDSDRIATFDVRKFYPSTSASRVHNFFADQLLCPPDVAAMLAKLTCYQGGLPTGSPLSPILSLYANKPMFESLNQLALTHALKFTCYVDDLTFSGDALPRGLTAMVTNIIGQYGHLISIGKTRIFRRNQSKHVTGVVLFKNSIHVPHSRFLKARAISTAIKNTKLPAEGLLLTKKLAGLLSEVAFLDSQFLAWAKRTYIAEKNESQGTRSCINT